jgi:hypothetical protein
MAKLRLRRTNPLAISDPVKTNGETGSAHIKRLEGVAGHFAVPAYSRPDRAQLLEEAQALTAHPSFDEAMRAFCRNLTDFHAPENARRVGIVDTITWAVAVLVLHFHFSEPSGVHASRLIDICRSGGLAGAVATRNAIYALRQRGMIAEDEAGPGLPRKLRPTAKLMATMQENLTVRLAAIERVIAFPAPAAEWARASGVLAAFLGGNVAAHRRDNFLLFEGFPEVRAFMDRRSGYLVLLDALSRAEATSEGAGTLAPPSELARRHAISRAHVLKLFGDAAAQGWLAYQAGGRVEFSAESYDRLRLWVGYEFAWTRRLLMAV